MKRLPQWVIVVLLLVLLLLLVVVVLQDSARRTSTPVINVSTVEMPPVVYEDFHDSDAIHDAGKAEKNVASTAKVIIDADPYGTHQVLATSRHGIALVMDDVGYDLPALKRVLALPIPVAISILPDAPKAREAAELAHSAGQVVMLHLPMEPANPHYRDKMDATFLRADMDQQTIQSMYLKALEKVPYVRGMNNHMGSMLTTLQQPMDWIMQIGEQRGLFFVDSKTASTSIADKTAESHGLPWAKRSVFLDHSSEAAEMDKAWQHVLACAKKQKSGCIIIAHPHAETLHFLEQRLQIAEPAEIQSFKPVDQLLHYPAS
ncbi:MAG: hypothetical protein CO186_02680 [Zetaproteobacteria bacterium CG_4_9_14_3_um_filter_49_83]|nr:MAG: hypothetical protein AUJ56_04030 [Zetaproteobacteria bacterium CG1_02_49_23]PIQ30470.1 MAG: hypothetical protein COW62_12265 [Zetaproteobacteria bacterium CG17_big_fil_post_rev_8_21_14_2_50_50_13]PIV29081.1 MAG: hypothetical protein COS35_13925 [Zetaproteobacteria bacterium CG02_land_8_20_14_3_00_50_9]PIY55252.1 MAG: hypothetical protein COZ00_10100 [Zetaproteobacteria bacterium CG_4_10_14_0_8_um_filter_49_80]PJA36064.1 MAG: hypothetical protein CO186_02680 [Zetaproteobacteria bacterium